MTDQRDDVKSPDPAEPERLFATRKAATMARLEEHGIPPKTVDAWLEAWEASDRRDSRHHPAFWEQAYQHVVRQWDAGESPPLPADTLIGEDDDVATPDAPRVAGHPRAPRQLGVLRRRANGRRGVGTILEGSFLIVMVVVLLVVFLPIVRKGIQARGPRDR